jgi:branched-chain amino acid transport system ATP-binding protein
MAAILRLEDLCKSFGAVVVADLFELEVAEGEAVGVIGPNGAGKTSLFNLITGTLRPDSGRVVFRGRDISALGPAERARLGIARSFQVPQPFSGLTVFENTMVAAVHAARLPRGAAERHCLEVLDRTGLLHRANVPAGRLTLLDRKRLELARALAAKPKLLLLDEIAGGLTEAECRQLVGTIREVRGTGVSIVWIEHVVHALLAVVERLVVIDFGRKIAEGEPLAVMASREVKEIYLGIEVDA